jgi:hypothetical protein
MGQPLKVIRHPDAQEQANDVIARADNVLHVPLQQMATFF